MAKITKIEVQKNNKERVNVFIDDTYAFSAFLEIIINNQIRKGMEVDDNVLSVINADERIKKCKNDALKIVERSFKTEKQVKDRLLKKEYTENEIGYAIDFLSEYGFIDDKKYCISYVNQKISKNGQNKIKFELKKKGISNIIINEVFDEINDSDVFEAAVAVGTKKYSQLIKKESDIYKIKNKLFAYLSSRGYQFEIIKKAISKIMTDG